MMDHAVDNSRGNRGITQVVSQLFEINISGNERRALALAVAAINNFEEERGIASVVLFQPVEAKLVNQEDIRPGVMFQSH